MARKPPKRPQRPGIIPALAVDFDTVIKALLGTPPPTGEKPKRKWNESKRPVGTPERQPTPEELEAVRHLLTETERQLKAVKKMLAAGKRLKKARRKR